MYEGKRTARTEVPCYYWACALTLWQRVYFYQPIGSWFWNNPRNSWGIKNQLDVTCCLYFTYMNNITFKPSTEKASLFQNKAQDRKTHNFKWPLASSPHIPHKQNSSASNWKRDTTKHHPQQTTTHKERRYVQGVSKRVLQLWKLIEIYTEDIHNVLNCQNIAKHTQFYLG